MRPTLALIITVLTIAVLYSPQPLLPVFAHEFAVRNSSAALLVSLTLAPLALAPLCYGFVLESFSPVQIIRCSVLLLAASEIAFPFCPNFPTLLTVRIFQGLIIPAILTSTMTYIATTTPPGKLQRIMSFYISATILGGFGGRLSSGILASFLGWRPFFIGLGFALAACFFRIGSPQVSSPAKTDKANFKTLLDILTAPRYRHPFAVTFCAFFVLASIMNFIPFRLLEIDPQTPQLLFGFIYTGYLAGILSSLMSARINRLFSSEKRAIRAGLSALGLSLVLLMIPSTPLAMFSLFILSAAMFLVHTIAANIVNQHDSANKGIVNGLYISFYYTGGTIGSYAPGLLYEHSNWTLYISALLCVILFGLYNASKMKLLHYKQDQGIKKETNVFPPRG